MTNEQFDLLKSHLRPMVKALLPKGWQHRFNKRYNMLILYPGNDFWNVIIELANVEYTTDELTVAYLKKIIDYEVEYARNMAENIK
jgi:hypothetical protein